MHTCVNNICKYTPSIALDVSCLQRSVRRADGNTCKDLVAQARRLATPCACRWRESVDLSTRFEPTTACGIRQNMNDRYTQPSPASDAAVAGSDPAVAGSDTIVADYTPAVAGSAAFPCSMVGGAQTSRWHRRCRECRRQSACSRSKASQGWQTLVYFHTSAETSIDNIIFFALSACM